MGPGPLALQTGPSLAGLAGALHTCSEPRPGRREHRPVAVRRLGQREVQGLGPTKAYPATQPIRGFVLLPKMELVPAVDPNWSPSANVQGEGFFRRHRSRGREYTAQ